MGGSDGHLGRPGRHFKKITIRTPHGCSVMVSSDPEQPYDNVKLAFSEGTWSLCCLFQNQHRACNGVAPAESHASCWGK